MDHHFYFYNSNCKPAAFGLYYLKYSNLVYNWQTSVLFLFCYSCFVTVPCLQVMAGVMGSTKEPQRWNWSGNYNIRDLVKTSFEIRIKYLTDINLM